MPHRPSKRKRDELEDSDEEPSLGRQILPVANLPEDFDGEPIDGSQYLFTVRWAASSLASPLTSTYSFADEMPDTYLVQRALPIPTK